MAEPPRDRQQDPARTVRFVYWRERDAWIGYLREFPDYWTQGDSLQDLRSHLCDLHADLTGGQLPGVRRAADLALA